MSVILVGKEVKQNCLLENKTVKMWLSFQNGRHAEVEWKSRLYKECK